MEPEKVIYVKENAFRNPGTPTVTFEGYSDRKDTDVKYIRADIAEPTLEALEVKITNAAYAVVCKMIDMGFIESEPEGLDMEHDIREILKKYFV